MFTTCCYGSWAPLIGFCCFLGNKVTHCIAQQPYQFTLCVLRCTLMGLCFLIRLAVPKYNQPNEALECRGKKNPNSDVGEMEPDVCDTELQVQGRIHAFKFSDVVGGFE